MVSQNVLAVAKFQP